MDENKFPKDENLQPDGQPPENQWPENEQTENQWTGDQPPEAQQMDDQPSENGASGDVSGEEVQNAIENKDAADVPGIGSDSAYIPLQPPVPEGGGELAVKKAGNKGMIALFAVIAVLIIAIIAVFAGGLLSKNPEETVQNAIDTTYDALLAKSEKINSEIPLNRIMLNQEKKPAKMNFEFGITGYDSGTGAMEDQMIAGLLQSFSITGDYSHVPESKFSEFNLALNMAQKPLITLFGQGTPDQIAVGMPAFSDKVLSANPNTFYEDFKNSALAELMEVTEEDILEFQEMLEAQTGVSGSFSGLDYKKLQSEMQEIMGRMLTDAVYASPRKENGMKLYDVTMNGVQVKQTVMELLNYIYVDSEIAKMYDSMFPKEMYGGMKFSELMKSEIIDVFDRSVSEISVKATYTIGNKNLISAVDTVISFPEMSGGSIISRYELDDNLNLSMNMAIKDLMINGETVNMTMDMKELYADGRQAVDMTVNMKDAYDEMVMMDMDMNLNMAMDKNGAVEFKMAFTDKETADGMGLDIAGTVTDTDGTTLYDFPEIKGSMQIGGQNASVSFKTRVETAPLAEPYPAVVTGTLPIFELDQEGVLGVIQEYSQGLDGLMNQLLGAAMGGTPEMGADAAA